MILGATGRRRLQPWAVIACAALSDRCATVDAPPAGLPARAAPVVRIGRIPGVSRIVWLSLDEYVAAVVATELGAGILQQGYGSEAARLQAVVSRTYTLTHLGRHRHEGFDLCATTHCQLFRPLTSVPPAAAAVAATAVRETQTLAILHAGHPIDALYHADCGGHTSAATDVWGGDAPSYLRAVADPTCPGKTRAPWHFAVRTDDLREALNADPRTSVGRHLARIEILARDEGGRAVRVALDGERSPVVRGEEFREVVIRRFGPPSLRSTQFSVAWNNGQFRFEGRGSGHGVGLCLAGALAQIRVGRPLKTILAAYYPGTSLGTWSRPLGTTW